MFSGLDEEYSARLPLTFLGIFFVVVVFGRALWWFWRNKKKTSERS